MTELTQDQTERLERVRADGLYEGGHDLWTAEAGGRCLLEACAYIAGEPHSDQPECVSPLLAAIGRTLNDRMPDGRRDRLIDTIPALLGTSTDDDSARHAHITRWLEHDVLSGWLARVDDPDIRAWRPGGDLRQLIGQLRRLSGIGAVDSLDDDAVDWWEEVRDALAIHVPAWGVATAIVGNIRYQVDDDARTADVVDAIGAAVVVVERKLKAESIVVAAESMRDLRHASEDQVIALLRDLASLASGPVEIDPTDADSYLCGDPECACADPVCPCDGVADCEDPLARHRHPNHPCGDPECCP